MPSRFLKTAIVAGIGACAWDFAAGFALPQRPTGATGAPLRRSAASRIAASEQSAGLPFFAALLGSSVAACCLASRVQDRHARRSSVQRCAEDAPNPVRMPMIATGSGSIDVMSKLVQDRILMLNGQVNDEMANVLVANILYLANQDSEKDITLYINSPGGSVSAGMAIFDAMTFVPCDVSTVCYGTAASMGAFLLGAGTKGKRRSLPNSRIMIHQPLGGAGGQAADIEIQAKEILFLRDILNTYLADFSGKSLEAIEKDCDRDYYMTPEDAKEYGMIDEVIETKSWPRLKKPVKQAFGVVQ